MKLLLLAGGPAKGLRLVTGRDGSRALVRLPGSTLLERHLRMLQNLVDEVIVVSDDPLVERVCRERPGCRFVAQQGSGVEPALCSGLAAMPGERGIVTILYGDIYYGKGFLESHVSTVVSEYTQLITVTRPVLLRGSYLRLDIDPVTRRVEKVGNGDYINAGLLSLYTQLLREQVCHGGRSLHDAIVAAVERGLYAVTWLGDWIDIDTPWDYMVAVRLALSELRATRIHQDAKIGRGVVLEGSVYVEPGAVIDHYAVVKGPAYIGPSTFIGAHSFVRESTAVLGSARVGAYSEVKRSVVYEKATIGSHSYIADSIIGAGAVVAPYTVTLNTPYTAEGTEVIIMTTSPLEKLKIGALIAAGSSTKPHMVLQPASIYRE